jgi:hypothetical protein
MVLTMASFGTLGGTGGGITGGICDSGGGSISISGGGVGVSEIKLLTIPPTMGILLINPLAIFLIGPSMPTGLPSPS